MGFVRSAEYKYISFMAARETDTGFEDNQVSAVLSLAPTVPLVSTDSINMNNSTILSAENQFRSISSQRGWMSIPLLAYFAAYSHISMGVWLQWVLAYSVRAGLLWTASSLFLLALRYVNRSVVSFVTETYAASFNFTLFIFGIIYFPKFTIAFMVIWIFWAFFWCIVRPVEPADKKASTTKV
ncbi:hypothetical protein F4801DRAFT_525484 [Xylaria longipes]|nr:hypothetical protein F4801DRAFT_525484 [Xylaria longipes]